MADAQSAKLATALRDRTLIDFTRPFEEATVSGYVLDIEPRWFLLALVDNCIHFNGFECFRLSDVRALRVPYPYAAFAEAALKKRGERRPRKPRVDIGSIEELLLSANRSFPLVTIHREKIDPGACHIGRVLEVVHGKVSLLRIRPDASWDTEAAQYRLRDITRVDFGGDYEEALHLVGGCPVAG